ncbi:MAG: IS200/IS605 family transposase [Mycobacterium sp.]
MSERRFGRIPGGVCWLGLHVVWGPKYRCRIVGGRVARWCGELLEQIADERGWQMVAQGVMAGHVHLFVLLGPTDAPAQVVRAFLGRTARVLGGGFRHLRNHARVLWSPSHLAASVGSVSESTVRRYIEHRWDAGIAS